jgi:preprotein translocase subunit SecG
MLTFVVIIHIVVALILITMVLLQDSKGGAMGGAFGGASSSSLLGATGGANLLTQLTRYAAIIFAITSITLTTLSSRKADSVIDDYVTPQSAELTEPKSEQAPAPEANTPAAAETAPEANSPKDSNK